MDIRPVGDRIVVQPLEAEEVTKGGIILPETAKEKPSEGKVVAVGRGKVGNDGKLQALEVKVGDRILYSKYGHTEFKVNGKDYLVMKEEDVYVIVSGK